MLNDALAKDSKETDLDGIALKTVEKRLANNQLIPGIGHGIHTGGDPRAERLFEVAQRNQSIRALLRPAQKNWQIADQKVGKHLPVNVTGAIAAISLDMGVHWQMSKSFAILGRALGGLAHVGEEIRRPSRAAFQLDPRQSSIRAGKINRQPRRTVGRPARPE